MKLSIVNRSIQLISSNGKHVVGRSCAQKKMGSSLERWNKAAKKRYTLLCLVGPSFPLRCPTMIIDSTTTGSRCSTYVPTKTITNTLRVSSFKATKRNAKFTTNRAKNKTSAILMVLTNDVMRSFFPSSGSASFAAPLPPCGAGFGGAEDRYLFWWLRERQRENALTAPRINEAMKSMSCTCLLACCTLNPYITALMQALRPTVK